MLTLSYTLFSLIGANLRLSLFVVSIYEDVREIVVGKGGCRHGVDTYRGIPSEILFILAVQLFLYFDKISTNIIKASFIFNINNFNRLYSFKSSTTKHKMYRVVNIFFGKVYVILPSRE